MARALISVPPAPRRGDIIEIRTLIAHPMETGFRAGSDGQRVPRDLIRRLSCRYDGELIFSAEFFAAVAANPYCAFHTIATNSGTLSFSWEGDNGFMQTETVAISVT
jgi:sulfur-oxidizing protein SoxZ